MTGNDGWPVLPILTKRAATGNVDGAFFLSTFDEPGGI
jgi:hypothetical protein